MRRWLVVSDVRVDLSELVVFVTEPRVQWKCRLCRGRYQRCEELREAVIAATAHLTERHSAVLLPGNARTASARQATARVAGAGVRAMVTERQSRGPGQKW